MHETSTRSPTLTVLDAGADRLDGADGLVAEDAAVGHRGDVALEDVQVGAADRDGVDPHDRVGVVDDDRRGDLLPRLLPGAVVHDCAHGSSLVAAPGGASPDGRATPADRSVPKSPADGATGGPKVSPGVSPGCSALCAPGVRRHRCRHEHTTTEQLATGRGSAAEVIAGLANDGSALTVARAAVEEAMSRHCGVRFVQVVSPGLDPEERAEVDAVMFQAALNALRGQPRLRCTFEVVNGSPGHTLVDRSRRATVLAVGDAAPGATAPWRRTAGSTPPARCRSSPRSHDPASADPPASRTAGRR